MMLRDMSDEAESSTRDDGKNRIDFELRRYETVRFRCLMDKNFQSTAHENCGETDFRRLKGNRIGSCCRVNRHISVKATRRGQARIWQDVEGGYSAIANFSSTDGPRIKTDSLTRDS